MIPEDVTLRPLVERLRCLPPSARAALFAEIGRTPGLLTDVRHDWPFWAHEHQVVTPEELERYALVLLTGPRGAGKTEAAVHTFNREILAGRAERPRVFAATEADVDKVVVHGPSGIMSALAPGDRPRWLAAEGSAGVLRYRNGIEAVCFTVKGSEAAVGHAGDLDLLDDYAKWGPHAETAYAHARISCRIGYACALMATTRRGVTLLRRLLASEIESVLVKRPTDLRVNRFNISPKNYRAVLAELGTTDLVRQELEDEDVSASSPFAGLDFDARPIRVLEVTRDTLREIVVAVDPADGKGGEHDEWGIGAAGRRADRHVVALDDASGSYDDDEGAGSALDLCERWGARTIVVEANRGPRVRSAIRAAFYQRQLERRGERVQAMPEIVGVTAREGKRLRAGPLRALYLQGVLHHVAGLGALERQMREWDPDGPKRPRQDDRIDWLVHAVHHLADLGAAGHVDRSGDVAAAKAVQAALVERIGPRPARGAGGYVAPGTVATWGRGGGFGGGRKL